MTDFEDGHQNCVISFKHTHGRPSRPNDYKVELTHTAVSAESMLGKSWTCQTLSQYGHFPLSLEFIVIIMINVPVIRLGVLLY